MGKAYPNYINIHMHVHSSWLSLFAWLKKTFLGLKYFFFEAKKIGPGTIGGEGGGWAWLIYTHIHTYIHYITLHYITLHYITLHYITLHTYIHIYEHMCIYIYIYIDIHMRIHTRIRIHIHKKHLYLHIYIYRYIDIHIYNTYTYTYT